tara:strand:- start:1586 stop:1795 length:210 start_codon:yes stop_codon:yes gene_type:complete
MEEVSTLPQEAIDVLNEQVEMIAQAFDSLTAESFRIISMMLCKQAFKRGETHALRQVREMIEEQKEMIK